MSTTTATDRRIAARAVGITKAYGSGEASVLALDEVSVEFDAGRFTAIMGPSGSGKSTLMHCLAGLDAAHPRRGLHRRHRGHRAAATGADRGCAGTRSGFIFQQFNLLPTLTAAREHPAAAVDRRTQARPGLVRHRHRHGGAAGPAWRTGRPALRRPAAARGRAPGPWSARPEVVFADEPTGNLDSRSGAEVLGLPARLRARATARPSSWSPTTPTRPRYADRVVFLADGHVVDELAEPTAGRGAGHHEAPRRPAPGRRDGGAVA